MIENYPDQVIIHMYELAMDDPDRRYLLVRIFGSILYTDKSYYYLRQK